VGLAALEQVGGLPLQPCTAVGELDRVRASVFGVAAATRVPLALELVDEGDHRRAVDGEDVGERLLGDGAEFGKHGEDPVMAAVDPERGEGSRPESGHAGARSHEHESEAPAERCGQRGHVAAGPRCGRHGR
jgi:hypothetical protein